MLDDKKSVLKWLRDERAISVHDNIIRAEKAFFANSVLVWCADETSKGTMNSAQIQNCIYTLRKYLRGKLDLCWDAGIIKVRKKKKKNTNKKKVQNVDIN